MDRQAQIDLLKRLLRHVESKTTALADRPWQNDTSVYFDPEHLAREEQILFRQYPLLMGFGSDWPGARFLSHRRLCRRANTCHAWAR
jgi:hypothetical protein